MQELWQEIWQTIRRNKWRSLMTAFGVFWGILMLIVLVGLGKGVFNGVASSMNNIPSNSVIMGGGHTSMPYKGLGHDRNITLENEDLDVLRTTLGQRVRYVTPIDEAPQQKVTLGDRYMDCGVYGTTSNYKDVVPTQVLFGRYLNEVDLHERRKVCVIGTKVYEQLFPQGGDPCGTLLKVGDLYYTVVGVIKKNSNIISLTSDIDRSLAIPFSTAQLSYGMGNQVYICVVTLNDKYPAKVWEDRILATLKERHMVHPDDRQAFWHMNLAEILGMFSNLFLGINILLWIVGCGSLFAGIIGISNIMLVTVRERTQEIGIRRALGAKPRTILTQIMSEALVLTTAAGVTGLVTGVWILHFTGFILLANSSSEQPLQDPQIGFSVAISALLVIILGGLFAGCMPARRAMKIRAIEALREE